MDGERFAFLCDIRGQHSSLNAVNTKASIPYPESGRGGPTVMVGRLGLKGIYERLLLDSPFDREGRGGGWPQYQYHCLKSESGGNEDRVTICHKKRG
uniref:Coiled-coil domain containing 106 n=1 Tax=Iconisemion striatum TaxID=60296 RepID=A0A1A7WD61_9TELE